jgi:predicted N-acetyltransferase YhbS
MTIQYQVNAPLQAEQVADVFRSSGIKRPVDDLDRIQSMLNHADITISAWDEETLVGLARAVTDFSYCCYLSDLAVRMEYQRNGIGKELVNLLKEQIGEEVSLLLLSAPSAMEYYPRIGFERTERAFIIPRAK